MVEQDEAFYRDVEKQEWPFVIVHTKAFGLAISLLITVRENIRYDAGIHAR